jgi:hypothetical protein
VSPIRSDPHPRIEPLRTDALSTTTFFYNQSLRLAGELLPDGSAITNSISRQDCCKRLVGLGFIRWYTPTIRRDESKPWKTRQNFSANSETALSTWSYDAYRGWLLSKRDNANYGPDTPTRKREESRSGARSYLIILALGGHHQPRRKSALQDLEGRGCQRYECLSHEYVKNGGFPVRWQMM